MSDRIKFTLDGQEVEAAPGEDSYFDFLEQHGIIERRASSF